MFIEFSPIGIIHSPFKTIENMPIQPSGGMGVEAKIEIYREFEDGLSDIEGFSHLYIIFHLNMSSKKKLKVVPFLDTVERGIFATRSPARPNPIGLSVVELVSVNRNILVIRGVDMLDGTPVIDIKPYVPEFENYKNIRTGWFNGKALRASDKLSDRRFK